MKITRMLSTLCAAAVTLALMTQVADARPRPRRGKRFEANKTFGLGIMLGAPSGLSGKYFYASDKAFDFGVGALGYYRHRSGFHIHADHLWHPVSLVSDRAFELPFYVGVGARLFDFDYDNNNINDHGTALGIRVPFGIAFDFNNTPLDIFVEVVPVFDFFFDYYDDTDFDLDASIGVRYWF